ncbi:hypothetical protein FA95DRAFT_1573903 [Auriscalpium vulgare]|uniref:Uncharacterized protein n=1 Tax=Auriscalpium vulgare TaxID=40419 RepID=A0ACB8RMY2_9AGAM|nr:hypothetical protein FA95DRAFT_1573903 [Auriscalpium vulgare]
MPPNAIHISLPHPGRVEFFYAPETDPRTGRPSPLHVRVSQGDILPTPPTVPSESSAQHVVYERRQDTDRPHWKSGMSVRAKGPSVKDSQQARVSGDQGSISDNITTTPLPRGNQNMLAPKSEPCSPHVPSPHHTPPASPAVGDTCSPGPALSSQSYTEPDTDIDPLMFVSSSMYASSDSEEPGGQVDQEYGVGTRSQEGGVASNASSGSTMPIEHRHHEPSGPSYRGARTPSARSDEADHARTPRHHDGSTPSPVRTRTNSNVLVPATPVKRPRPGSLDEADGMRSRAMRVRDFTSAK